MAKSIESLISSLRQDVLQMEKVQVREVKNAKGKVYRRDHIYSISREQEDGVINAETIVITEILDDKGNVVKVGTNKPIRVKKEEDRGVSKEEIINGLESAGINYADFIIQQVMDKSVEVMVYEYGNEGVVKNNYLVIKGSKGIEVEKVN